MSAPRYRWSIGDWIAGTWLAAAGVVLAVMDFADHAGWPA